jgi:hypothetical protein
MYISAPSPVSLVKAIGGTEGSGAAKGRASVVSALYQQQTTHFDLGDAHRVHAWLRAATAAFGRTVVGPGMNIVRDQFYGSEATQEEYATLYAFYNSTAGRDFKNISDWYTFSGKLYRTAGMFRMFGQACWELRRNGFGEAVSFDVVPGFVWPNCNEDGTFRDPPFLQYLSSSKPSPIELDPDDLAFFMNPDFTARLFATDFESLAEYVLPTDLYLVTAMRSLLENIRTPFGVFSLDENSTQEEVETFSTKLDALYRGATNYGKSAVVVRGQTDLKTFAPAIKDLPFDGGHNTMKDEIEGVSGVHGGKLGRTDEISRSNLREVRRDYWETTHQPVAMMLSEMMYVLIHQRIFGIRSWRPMFKSPDFLTQVERATVGMRGRQWGALNTNEFRDFVFNMLPLEDDWANEDYMWPTNMGIAGTFYNPPTKTEEPVDEDKPDEPSTEVDPPIRGDTNNTEGRRERSIAEMRAYARFCLNRLDKPATREFRWTHVSREVVSLVDAALTEAKTRDQVKQVFDAVISGMRGE